MRSDHLSKHLKTHQLRRQQAEAAAIRQQEQGNQNGDDEDNLILDQTDIELEGK